MEITYCKILGKDSKILLKEGKMIDLCSVNECIKVQFAPNCDNKVRNSERVGHVRMCSDKIKKRRRDSGCRAVS